MEAEKKGATIELPHYFQAKASHRRSDRALSYISRQEPWQVRARPVPVGPHGTPATNLLLHMSGLLGAYFIVILEPISCEMFAPTRWKTSSTGNLSPEGSHACVDESSRMRTYTNSRGRPDWTTSLVIIVVPLILVPDPLRACWPYSSPYVPRRCHRQLAMGWQKTSGINREDYMVNPVSKEEITLDHILAAEYIQKAFRRFKDLRGPEGGLERSTSTPALPPEAQGDGNRDPLASRSRDPRGSESMRQRRLSSGGVVRHQASRPGASNPDASAVVQERKGPPTNGGLGQESGSNPDHVEQGEGLAPGGESGRRREDERGSVRPRRGSRQSGDSRDSVGESPKPSCTPQPSAETQASAGARTEPWESPEEPSSQPPAAPPDQRVGRRRGIFAFLFGRGGRSDGNR